jgi:uncharacterized protein (DUF433 family)
MQLEDYFEFEKFPSKFGEVERIRIKGHRIAIDFVIEAFNDGVQPDRIQQEMYPTLTLEEVYATITYYLHNKAEVDAYRARREAIGDQYYQEYLRKEPSPVVKRLRALKAQPELLRQMQEERARQVEREKRGEA